ncbi:class I SAM-dependent DNA methyltransferase [Solidesulfovibrio sp.]
MSEQLVEFIARWERSQAAERANAQLFLAELCDVLDVSRPDPAVNDPTSDAYVFERGVVFQNGDGTTSLGRIDLYRRGCFVLETKQGASAKAEDAPEPARPRRTGHGVRATGQWDTSMRRARGQAESYARALDPGSEGRPPFIIIVDVGHCFELYSEFSRTGGAYTPFPDARGNRLSLSDLHKPEVRDLLRRIWLDPMSLDPTRVSARVTREAADKLATLARSLENAGHEAGRTAHFLMRCLFTMFAEDVGLIPADCFRDLLSSLVDTPELFPPLVSEVWETMNAGGVSRTLRKQLARFNGGLFAEAEALPLTTEQIALLVEAAKADWKDVEPAIFGTLLERALDPKERHRLGAHYTPRGYVERLVLPTVIEPLRERWRAVETAAALLVNQGKRDEAVAEIRRFHAELCKVRVLDPACGTGNFLYVAMEHMKRLEGEVIAMGESVAGRGFLMAEMARMTVDPSQFLGLEVNPRAAAIAELVLWIGYLQWHFRTFGNVQPSEPIIKDFHGIENRDALLVWDAIETLIDEHGQPVTHWDGRTFKVHVITGRNVPDESAQVPEVRFVKPRATVWPEADFIVGNPPFIGAKLIRQALGDGYFEALAKAYPKLPGFTDFVMYWWHKAAGYVRDGRARRFGFITTNSLSQIFNRKVTALHLETGGKPLSLAFAIPDHPWVDATDGASVRVAMTVGVAGVTDGILATVVSEKATDGPERQISLEPWIGRINPDLTIGANVASAMPLRANGGISGFGMALHGSGFIVTPKEAEELGLGRIPGLEAHIRPYRNGRDITGGSRGVMVIDLFGLAIQEVRDRFPEVYQWVLERVKPERDHNNRASLREQWWVFGWPRPVLRAAKAGLSRIIVTPETAKHRFFVFLDQGMVPDHKLVCTASEDAYYLGILSSRIHVVWALAAGGRLGVGNDPCYNSTRCFAPFPFPDPTPKLKQRIRELGERLDVHRKARQTEYPDLTLTGMYNVLETLRAEQTLNDKERDTHEKGLVTMLREIHDELDTAVAMAYGWPADLPEAEILARLVALNKTRAAEEQRDVVRWLRPEYQNPGGVAGETLPLAVAVTKKVVVALKAPWPSTLPEQAQAIAATLAAQNEPATPAQVAKMFSRAKTARVTEILETLASLGQARRVGDNVYAAA